jgi:hypothetical protein
VVILEAFMFFPRVRIWDMVSFLPDFRAHWFAVLPDVDTSSRHSSVDLHVTNVRGFSQKWLNFFAQVHITCVISVVIWFSIDEEQSRYSVVFINSILVLRTSNF